MNNDRGMIKWQPFNSLISLNDIKNKIKEEKNNLTYPLLSEDELTIIENNLLMAYHSKEEVLITYFYNHNLYKIKGTIDMIVQDQKLIILNKSIKLYFKQITEVILL